MVVWLSCYAWVPVVVLMAYDRAQRIFKNCCKKKKPNNTINANNNNNKKEEKEALNDSKEKSE